MTVAEAARLDLTLAPWRVSETTEARWARGNGTAASINRLVGWWVGWSVGQSIDRSVGGSIGGAGSVVVGSRNARESQPRGVLPRSSLRQADEERSRACWRRDLNIARESDMCVMQDAAPFVRCLGWGDWSIHSLIRSTQWLAWAWAWGRVALEVGASSGVLSAPASRGITEQTTRCVCVHMFVPHPTSGSIHTPHPNQPASQGAANHHQQQQPPLWSCRRRRASSDATVCTHAHSACCLSPPSDRSC